jgi:hypothetical protein
MLNMFELFKGSDNFVFWAGGSDGWDFLPSYD